MRNNGEGVGRLSVEDLAAMSSRPEVESATDYIKRLIAESEAKIEVAEAEARKATVLGRAAVVVTPYGGKGISATEQAELAFDILDALEAEYERRQKRG